MKIGKIPETVLKRSVFKLIRHRRKEVIVRPGVGLDCAHIEIAPDEVMVMSTDPITGAAKDIGTLAVHITANDIAASGAEPIGIMVTALLPPLTEEIQIKQVMKELEAGCESLNMEILGGHTEITGVVNQIVLTITGVGKIKKERVQNRKNIQVGDEIVMTKWAGLEGTAIIANEKKEELLSRYTSDFIDGACAFMNHLSVVKEASIAANEGALLMHDVTEGGVFGAFWEIAEAGRCGIEVDLKKIPIKQETIEICEFYDLNPYLLMSSGSLIIITKKGNQLVKTLAENGIESSVVGVVTSGKNKVVHNEDEMRFLDPPSADELYKVMK